MMWMAWMAYPTSLVNPISQGLGACCGESLQNPEENPQASVQYAEGMLGESTAYSQGILKTLKEFFANYVQS